MVISRTKIGGINKITFEESLPVFGKQKDKRSEAEKFFASMMREKWLQKRNTLQKKETQE